MFQPVKFDFNKYDKGETFDSPKSMFYKSFIDFHRDIDKKTKSFDLESRSQNEIEKQKTKERQAQQIGILQDLDKAAQNDLRIKDCLNQLTAYSNTSSNKVIKQLIHDLKSKFNPSNSNNFLNLFESIFSKASHVNIFELKCINKILLDHDFQSSHLKDLIEKASSLENEIKQTIQAINCLTFASDESKSLQTKLQSLIHNKYLVYLDSSYNSHVEESLDFLLALPPKAVSNQISVSQESKDLEILPLSQSSDSIKQLFPYIRSVTNESPFQIYETLSIPNLLGPDIVAQYQYLISSIQNIFKFYLETSLISEETKDPTNTTIPLSYITKLAVLSEETVQILTNIDSKVGQKLIFDIISESLNQIENQQQSDSQTLMYATLLFSFRDLLSANQKKLFNKILQYKLNKISHLIQPNFFTRNQAIKSTEKEKQLFILFSFFIAFSIVDQNQNGSSTSDFSLAIGWSWILRTCKQLHYLIYLTNTSEGNSKSEGLLQIKNLLYFFKIFIDYTSASLIQSYQVKYFELLSQILLYFRSLDSKLLPYSDFRWIEKIIESKKATPIYYNHQDPFVVQFYISASKAEKALNDVNIIDADKTNPLMIKIKEYQLDRLRAIFNRISVTVQSQENAVSALFEKILLTKDNPDLLRYLLFKIVQNLLKDTQGEHFKIEDEAQPMRISRVICSLCMKINVLTDFVKSQFYMTCPLLYPKVISEGLSTHDFFISMAFNTKPTKDNSIKWENNDDWLARMTKVMVVFAKLCIQPEQNPFTLSDIWNVLTRAMNSCIRHPSPPFYTATIFEVILRVSSLELHQKYGVHFMGLLKVIESDILPKLIQEMPRRPALVEYLARYIPSNGQDFMRYYEIIDASKILVDNGVSIQGTGDD